MFLENAGYLLAVLLAIQCAGVLLWSWRRTRLAARAVMVGFALFPALVLLNALIITPRERIIHLCRDLANMVDDGDVAAIDSCLAETFRAGKADRSRFLDRLRSRLTDYRVDDPRLRDFEVTFPQPDRAVAVFGARCRVRSSAKRIAADAFLERLRSRWRLTFRRTAERWLVIGVEALPVPFSPGLDPLCGRDLQALTR